MDPSGRRGPAEDVSDYFKNKDRSKYFQELLEKWNPSRGLDKYEHITETMLRDSFKDFIDKNEDSMEHPKEVIVGNRRRADLSLIFNSPYEGEIKHLVEFKYGLSSTTIVDRLRSQIDNYWKEKVRHVYVVILEDEKRSKNVREDLLDELKEKYSKP
ncbi:MAG: hypothetical protein ACP5LH_03730, partial [Candidatus Micrarchaeia archaeon]